MASENVKIVTDNSFESEVLQSNKPFLVDLWAGWCGPSNLIAHQVEAIAKDYKETLQVGMLDVDCNPTIPERYGIDGIPTLLLFKNGELVENITGVLLKDHIEVRIFPHLKC